MFDRVPTEIALRILHDVAESDREAGIALAQTCQVAYSIVTPILFRRVGVLQSNIARVERVLRRPDLASLVIELTVITLEDKWKPKEEIFAHLSNLEYLRATDDVVAIALSGLPPTARSSLRKLWFTKMESPFMMEIPSTVTHLCLPAILPIINRAPMKLIVQQVIKTVSVTHLACDFTHPDWHKIDLKPDHLVQSLCEIFETVGDRMQLVSLRFGGVVAPLLPDDWETVTIALASAIKDNDRAVHWMNKISAWYDERYCGGFYTEEMAALEDTMDGLDVWTETQALAEFLR